MVVRNSLTAHEDWAKAAWPETIHVKHYQIKCPHALDYACIGIYFRRVKNPLLMGVACMGCVLPYRLIIYLLLCILQSILFTLMEQHFSYHYITPLTHHDRGTETVQEQ